MKKCILLWLFVAICVGQAFAQTRTITGTVTDAKDGSPLPGVTVVVKGTNKGTQTKGDGTYSLETPSGATLVFSFIGFGNQEVAVGSQEHINVALGADNKELSEVVVTALGIKREKRTLAYTTQEVKGDDLVRSKETNFLNGLQGKVAGVQINSNSGQPGSGSRIVIRGASTLTGNNQPLFVVDGVPIDNRQIGAGDDDPVLFGGSTPNRGIDIDPNIIESVNVLRGASATALYGSRASGGAIIITTKSGQGRPKGLSVTVSSGLNFDKPIMPEFQDKYSLGFNGEYYDGVNDKISASWGARMDTLRINGQPAPKYNNRDAFFRTGVTTDNSLSVTGATDRSSFLLSYSLLKQEGVVPNTDYGRHSIYGNFSTKINDKLTVTASVNYIHSDNNRQTEGNGRTSYLWGIYSAPVSFNLKPVFDEDGNQRMFRVNTNNPYWAIDNINLNLRVDRFLPNVTFVYQPLNWLTFTERIGADIYTDTRKFHEAIGSFGTYPTGRIFDEQVTNRQINHDFYAQATRALNDNLDLSVMLGNNIISEYNLDVFTKGIGLSAPNFYHMTNADVVSSNTTFDNRRRVSLYGQAVLEYKKMLSLTVTGRNDWSSTLPRNNRSYFYPSVAGAFIFSELPGLKDSRALSFGKLRAAYTVIGNDARPYITTTNYTKPSIGDGQRGEITLPFNSKNAFLLNNVQGNAALKPERIAEFEVGLETKWLDNRLGLEANYYTKKSTDLIFKTPIGPSTGFVEGWVNAGELTNKGVEITLTANPIRTTNFNWNLSVNWSKNEGKINSLYPGIPAIQIGGFTDPGIFLVAGQPYGSLYGGKWERNENGQMLIDDKGYPIPSSEVGVIGNATPEWIGGITNEFSYKGITLAFTWDGKKGGDVINMDNYYLGSIGILKYTESRDDPNATRLFEGVRASDGKPNTTPVRKDQTYYYDKVNGLGIAEAWVEDGSFIKLRNVSLAYSLDKRLLGRTPIKGATISVSGRNLWIHAPHFTGSDPELNLYGSGSNSQGFYNFVTPTTKTYSVALKLTF